MLKKIAKKVLLRIRRLAGTAGAERPNPIHLWENDEHFMDSMSFVEGHTLVDDVRCFILYQLGRQAASIPGDVAEVGVYKGGTAMLLSRTFAATGKDVHLFDTFLGMPPTDPEKDLHRAGDFSDTSLDAVKDYLSEFDNVKFYPGRFPDTAAGLRDNRFAMTHIDVDIYQSVNDCMEFFYPRLAPGGIMVFDDYGFVTCPGAKQAVDEFFAEKPEWPCYLPTGQCVVIKLGS